MPACRSACCISSLPERHRRPPRRTSPLRCRAVRRRSGTSSCSERVSVPRSARAFPARAAASKSSPPACCRGTCAATAFPIAPARMIEYFDRVEDDGASYLVLTSVVQDPTYLTEEYVTSYEYKLESDGSKWHPQPCEVRPPSSKSVPGNVYG